MFGKSIEVRPMFNVRLRVPCNGLSCFVPWCQKVGATGDRIHTTYVLRLEIEADDIDVSADRLVYRISLSGEGRIRIFSIFLYPELDIRVE